MTEIEGGHVDDRVGAAPGPDSVNRRVSGPGTEPGSVPGLVRLKWAICKRGYGGTIADIDNSLLPSLRIAHAHTLDHLHEKLPCTCCTEGTSFLTITSSA